MRRRTAFLVIVSGIFLMEAIMASESAAWPWGIRSFSRLKNWSACPGSTLEEDSRSDSPTKGCLLWSVEVSKTENAPYLCWVQNLSIKPDKLLSIQVYPSNAFMLLALEDEVGQVAFQGIPAGLVPNAWNEIRLSPAALPVMGSPIARLGKVKKIGFIIEGGAGEIKTSGLYTYAFKSAKTVSPKKAALKPLAPASERGKTYSDVEPLAQENFDRRWKALEANLPRVYELYKRYEQEGRSLDYEAASLAVFFDRDAVPEDYAKGLKGRATKALVFYEDCLARTEQRLRSLAEGSYNPLTIPNPQMKDLSMRKGFYYSGNQPVILTGLVGWGLDQQLPLFKQMGLNFFSIETGLAGTCPDEKTRKLEEQVTKSLDAAAECNMAMDLLISPHYFPEWAYTKYPDIDPKNFRRDRSPFSPWNVSDPDFGNLVQEYVSYLIPQVKDHSSLASIDLANEVWWELGADYPLKDFQTFLKERYKDLSPLNFRWGTFFTDWNQVNVRVSSPASWIDFNDFNQTRLSDFYSRYAEGVRKVGCDKTVYAKVIGSEHSVIGVDKDLFTQALTGCGTDCYPRLASSETPLAVYFREQQSILDLYRSCYPEKPILDTEYHIVFYNDIVSPSYIKSLLWDGAIHGRGAAALWAWDRNIENDAQSLFTQPWAVEALAHTSLDLRRFSNEVVDLANVKREVALLYSGPAYLDVYESLYFTGLPFDVLTDRRCTADALGGYKILVIPPASPATDEAFADLVTYAKNGGTVLMWESSLKTDFYGRERDTSALLDAVKGIGVLDSTALGRSLTQVIHKAVSSVNLEESRPLNLLNKAGESAPYVTWRAKLKDGKILLYALNYGREDQVADAVPCGGVSLGDGIDLKTGYSVGSSMKLRSLEPRLISYDVR